MNKEKAARWKKLTVPVLFCMFVILSVILNVKMRDQPKQEMGTKVNARVTEIKTKRGLLNPGKLHVTVEYDGQEYKLKGVPSNALYNMKNSKAYGADVEAWLYNGGLYYSPANIITWVDMVYYGCLLGALCSGSLLFLMAKEKYLKK